MKKVELPEGETWQIVYSETSPGKEDSIFGALCVNSPDAFISFYAPERLSLQLADRFIVFENTENGICVFKTTGSLDNFFIDVFFVFGIT